MAEEPTDVDLIRDVLAGRVERFEVLVRRYQRLVATGYPWPPAIDDLLIDAVTGLGE